MNYTKLLKNGLKLCNHETLENYLDEAVIYHQRHELVSAIDRKEWPTFNYQNSLTHAWTPFIVTLNENLTKFDVYRVFGLDEKEVAQVPVKNVLAPSLLQKYHLASTKPTSKKKPSKKVNTAKVTKKTTTRGKKSTKKTKSSKKASRKGSKRNKK